MAFAAFAREELGRANILFDLRTKALAGKTVTKEKIVEACNDHVTKQKWAVLSTVISVDRDSVLGKLVQAKAQAHPQSEEWKSADKELRKIDEGQLKRASGDRYQRRLRGIYVDPDDSGTGWNRPRDVDQRAAYDFLVHAVNDYAVATQKVEPELLKGCDDQLLQELTEWTAR